MRERARLRRNRGAAAPEARAQAPIVGPVCVTGASGFIGRHLREHLAHMALAPLHCLTRNPASMQGQPQLAVTGGDMRDAAALERFVRPGATVFNLAFDRNASLDMHTRIARTLAQACEMRRVVRLVHLSTATVVGDNRDPLIDERSRCTPVTAYDRAKLAIEETLAASLRRTELVILRPTAVFGLGGRNLVKLADEIAAGNAAARYLRACFHGRRPLNLVSVENVVAALVFLAHVRLPPGEQVYIVSDGEERTNNYRDVERTLARAFGRRDHVLPVLALPARLRDHALRRGVRRLEANSERLFVSARLARLGYAKPVAFESALTVYADYLVAQFRQDGKVSG